MISLVLGMNDSDQWRSHWIDCLVREGVLQRRLVPHRHNPDDLVPVISLPEVDDNQFRARGDSEYPSRMSPSKNGEGLALDDLAEQDAGTSLMAKRVIVSVEQFTSFRKL